MSVPAPRERIERALGSGWALAVILALAAALRLGHVLELRALPVFDRLILDAEFYDTWARRLAGGDWLDGTRPFFFDALYPYFLGALYATVGRDLLLVRLLQVALGTGTCALAALAGRRIAGRAIGNLAALLVAVYGPAIFEEAELEKTALGVFLAAVALVLALRRPVLARGAAGVALGLAALARGNMILVIPAAALWFLLEPGEDRPPRPHRIRSALAFAAGAALAIAPITWRNHHVSGEWVLTTSGGGPNLYLGNNPWNTSGGYQHVPWIRPQSAHEENDWRAETARRLGRPVTSTEVSRYWVGETVRHVLANPGDTAHLWLKKAGRLLANRELADGWDYEFLSRFGLVLRLPLLGFGVLLPLAVVGAVAGRRRVEVQLLAGYAGLYLGTILLFWVFGRFRLYVLPALAVLAALGIDALARAAADRAWAAVRTPALAGAVVALASLSAPAWADLARPSLGQNYANLGGLYFERGDATRAVAVLSEGAREWPGDAAILCKLGELRIRTADPAGAIPYLARCVAARPDFPDGWYWLGVAYSRAGDRVNAAVAFQRQLAMVPGHEYAARELAAMTNR